MRSPLRRLAVTAIASSILLSGTVVSARPGVGQPPAVSPSALPRRGPTLNINGAVKITKECSPEFQSWVSALSFYERPFQICARWSNKQTVKWARWHLIKKGINGAKDIEIASKVIPSDIVALSSTDFLLDLKAFLPQFNTGSVAQDYLVKVSSMKEGGTTELWSTAGKLTQLPKAGEPVPAKVDPYTCAPGKYARDVYLEVPQMTVNDTTSTAGDAGGGGRDELYFSISRLGPGTDSRQVRLPYIDNYYEAMNGATVKENGWTDKDQKHRTNPQLYGGTIEHGKTMTLAVRIGEQDNGDLKSIKSGIKQALDGIAEIAKEIPGWGTIVAAVAKVGSAAAGNLPDTDGDDVIAFATVQVTNKCGNLQTTWVTFASKSFAGAGTISNDFLDVETQSSVEARLVVLNTAPQGFYTDYGPFTWVGVEDQFWWIAHGTSGAAYTFLVKQHAEAG
jgi:hypothetical protein